MMKSLYTKSDGFFALLLVMIFTGLLSSVSALAGTPLPIKPTMEGEAKWAVEHPSANVVLYRSAASTATGSLYYRAYVDGRYIGKMRSNTAFHLELSAGEHVITLNDPKQTRLTVQVSDSQVSYIHVSVDKRWRAKLDRSESDSLMVAKLRSCAEVFQHRCVKPLLDCCGSETKSNRYAVR